MFMIKVSSILGLKNDLALTVTHEKKTFSFVVIEL